MTATEKPQTFHLWFGGGDSYKYGGEFSSISKAEAAAANWGRGDWTISNNKRQAVVRSEAL